MISSSTYLGTVQDVKGTTVRLVLENEALSGTTLINGQGYRIGQIGTFVKIPIGFIQLYGIVSQVGASAVPENQVENQPYGNRWMTIQLIGEGQGGGKFQRGISQYPTISDEVHLVSEEDLKKIYGENQEDFFVKIGSIAGAESIPALLDINKLITRHCAIVGSTGSGKSTTVAGILNALSNKEKYPSSRILVLDIHGEYPQALHERANIYRIGAEKTSQYEEKELHIPFWALNFEELMQVTIQDNFSREQDRSAVLERILDLKRESIHKYPKIGINIDTVSEDSPIPFNINKFWYDLYSEVFATYYSDNGKKPIQENWAYEKDEDGNELKGDIDRAIPPKFKPVKSVRDDPEKINYVQSPLNIRSQLEALGSKLRIPRYNFLFRPGKWDPDHEGKVGKDLNHLMKEWIGDQKPITILDLSGVPSEILNTIVGVLLRIIYDALFWTRNLSQGGRHRPLLVVMEEAHNYLNDDFKGLASTIVQRIAKEGRKYGIGAMIVSQRPSEINSTILSQCGTFISLRLANQIDRGQVSSVVSDNLDGLTDMLPILRTGEAIVLGESVKLPMRALINAPEKNKRPDSQDPIVFDLVSPEDSMNPGGWGVKMEENPNYEEFIQVWRSQNPKLLIKKEEENE
ncbi:MAG: DUF87 domain-containing protein [Balneola sp.]